MTHALRGDLLEVGERRDLLRLAPRDSWRQEEAGTPVEAPELGDLVTYGGDRADHIAFWLGEGRILHATAREGLGVVEEREPPDLRARRRLAVRL